MASIGTVFEQVVGSGGPRTAALTLISNQPDGICIYVTGTLSRRDGSLRGDVRMLFSDRVRSIAEPGSTFLTQQPFSTQGAQPAVAAVHRSGGSYELVLEIPAPFNRKYHMRLTTVDDVAYGSSPAIGNSEPVDRAVHLVSLKAGAHLA